MEGTGLEQLFSRAWSASTWSNDFFMHGQGLALRSTARNHGVFQDFSDILGLIYGAFFGFRVLKDPRRYTQLAGGTDGLEGRTGRVQQIIGWGGAIYGFCLLGFGIGTTGLLEHQGPRTDTRAQQDN